MYMRLAFNFKRPKASFFFPIKIKYKMQKYTLLTFDLKLTQTFLLE